MNFGVFTSRTFLGTVAAIVATGAVLNLANQGKLGMTAKKFANYVTTGYGAGSLS